MSGVNYVTIEYTWKWVPNQMGDLFDAGGSLVKGFNLWDRETLINKYEADFYNGKPDADPRLRSRAATMDGEARRNSWMRRLTTAPLL